MKKFLIALVCLFQAGIASADLSAEQIKSILVSGAGMSSKQADKIIENLKNEYGMDHNSKLKIAGVLTGSRFNYGIFKDRKTWDLDGSFSVDNDLANVSNLLKAEFFNGGTKIKVLTYDFLVVFLPSGASLESLNGLVTKRGLALAPQKIFGVTLGFVPSKIGVIGILGGSIGLGLGGITFPKFKFKVNPEYLK